MKQFWLQVDLEDLSSFDAVLADLLQRNPSEYLPLVRLKKCLPMYMGGGGGGGRVERRQSLIEREENEIAHILCEGG